MDHERPAATICKLEWYRPTTIRLFVNHFPVTLGILHETITHQNLRICLGDLQRAKDINPVGILPSSSKIQQESLENQENTGLEPDPSPKHKTNSEKRKAQLRA